MSTLNEPSPRLIQVLALEGVQLAPERCVDHHGLLQILNDIVEIEDPGGFFRGGYRMLLVLWWRWTPFFVPENGLYLLRVRESLGAGLLCIRLPRGGGEKLPKPRCSPPSRTCRNRALCERHHSTRLAHGATALHSVHFCRRALVQALMPAAVTVELEVFA